MKFSFLQKVAPFMKQRLFAFPGAAGPVLAIWGGPPPSTEESSHDASHRGGGRRNFSREAGSAPPLHHVCVCGWVSGWECICVCWSVYVRVSVSVCAPPAQIRSLPPPSPSPVPAPPPPPPPASWAPARPSERPCSTGFTMTHVSHISREFSETYIKPVVF